jgi:hypothetical protein
MSTKQHMVDANTTAWTVQVWSSWVIAMGLTVFGVLALPTPDPWSKGFVLMGLMFSVGSTFTLAKTTRDNAESKRLRNRIESAKTDKILRDFELSDVA